LKLACCTLALWTAAAWAGGCDKPAAYYAEHHYRIASVKLESPFDFAGSVRNEMAAALGAAKARVGAVFTEEALIEDRKAIGARLRATGNSLNLPVTVNVAIAEIEGCADSPPTVNVVYRAFASWFPFRFAQTFERRAAEASDPEKSAGVADNRWRLIPQAGYNHSARLFGGARGFAETPLGKLDFDGFASSSTAFVSTSNAGRHTWNRGWIQSAEWHTGYTYSDQPAETGHLTSARLSSQFAVNSRALGAAGWLIRMGGAVSGGHQQSTIAPAGLPPDSPLNNAAGDLKFYAGTSVVTGRQSFKASYGLKVGQASTGARIDFAKHIADVAYDVRFLPRDHRPIEIETRFTAGAIQNLGAIPVEERFFGGNRQQDFLLGDAWEIRATPFIRSFPQNRLDRLAPGAAIGGERFVSFNVTAGFTAWNRPLVPDELNRNPEFRPTLDGALNTAQNSIELYWTAEDPALDGAVKLAPVDTIRALRVRFNEIESTEERFGECDFELTLAEGGAKQMESTNRVSQKAALASLVEADGDGSIDRLLACVADLRGPLGGAFADSTAQALETSQTAIRSALARINVAAAHARAARDMAFVRQTLGTLLDEVNLLSVSPIAIFDAARIGPQPAGAGGGFRYAIGGGIRVSLLNSVRVSAGYAFNPNPKPWEGRGAAFASLEIVSLFR
jgi:hypothetical protein